MVKNFNPTSFVVDFFLTVKSSGKFHWQKIVTIKSTGKYDW